MNALSARARVAGRGVGGGCLKKMAIVTMRAWCRTSSHATAQSSMSCSASHESATGVNKIEGPWVCRTDRQRPPHHCMHGPHVYRVTECSECGAMVSTNNTRQTDAYKEANRMGFPPVLLQSSNRDIGVKRRWCAQSSIGAHGGGCCSAPHTVNECVAREWFKGCDF